jgi:hypothetical protein
MSGGWVQVAQEALKLPGLIVEIYGDAAKPGVRQVGKALETVLGLGNTVLWPITWANERSRIYLEKNLESYRKRLEAIPTDRIAEVPPEVGVPIAEKLAYVRDQRLSDLYVSLLAKASCVDTIEQAHPSFVNVINNLSPDEAKLLEYFVRHVDLIFVTAKWFDTKMNTYGFAGQFLLHPDRLVGLTFPSNVPAYLSNLSGLGLISIHDDRTVADDAPYADYKAVENYWRSILPTKNEEFPERVLQIERGVICRTEFGRQFIRACHQ